MTKIKTAQASSSLHHKLGRHDEEACKLEADEAFFLREVAANEDDGWESRGRNRATITSHVGHASSDSGVGFSGMGMGGINGVGTSSSTGKVLGRKASRSLSVDETFLPPPPPLVPQQRTPSASSMMRAAFKTNSFGDLVGVTGGGVAGGFAVPPELYSEGFCASSGLSPVGPFLSGQGVTPSDGNTNTFSEPYCVLCVAMINIDLFILCCIRYSTRCQWQQSLRTAESEHREHKFDVEVSGRHERLLSRSGECARRRCAWRGAAASPGPQRQDESVELQCGAHAHCQCRKWRLDLFEQSWKWGEW